MASKRVSPKPASFASEFELDYWHSAQDIAFRANAALIVRDGATWLVGDDGERLICTPSRPDKIWFETWRVLRREFPALSRLWLGGRALTKPGEL